jgi:uncharacterized protein
MRMLRTVLTSAALLLAAAAVPPVLAQDEKPSEESVRQIFELTHLGSLMESMAKQVEASSRTAMDQALAGRELSDEQRHMIEDLHARQQAAVHDFLNWKNLEPAIVSAYRDNFTQKEIDGLIDFYRTDTGKALIAKMPAVTHSMLQGLQPQMQQLMHRVMQMQDETVARIKAASPGAPKQSG